MGASKRVAELVIHALALDQGSTHKTHSVMVCSGNVLEPSESVVPLFLSQIASGGPIILAHPHMFRYFMTTTEADQLLLYASALAEGGDLSLLGIGDPYRIIDLAT